VASDAESGTACLTISRNFESGSQLERLHGTRAGLYEERMRFLGHSLTVENGKFAPQLHIRIVRPASAFRRDPLYIFGWVLDVASFAMDAILRIDDEAWIHAVSLVLVYDFVHPSRAVKARRFSEPGKIVPDRDVGIM
jgi:hypothetical protein